MEVNPQEQPQKVPTFLRVLSVLSLITIIYHLLENVLGLFVGPPSAETINEYIANNMGSINQLHEMGEFYWADTMSKILNLIRYTSHNFYMDKLINIGTYCIGLAGVVFMVRGRKLGFHLYIIYNLIALISIYASAPAYAVPPFYFFLFGFISLVFIFMYSRNLKFMK